MPAAAPLVSEMPEVPEQPPAWAGSADAHDRARALRHLQHGSAKALPWAQAAASNLQTAFGRAPPATEPTPPLPSLQIAPLPTVRVGEPWRHALTTNLPAELDGTWAIDHANNSSTDFQLLPDGDLRVRATAADVGSWRLPLIFHTEQIDLVCSSC